LLLRAVDVDVPVAARDRRPERVVVGRARRAGPRPGEDDSEQRGVPERSGHREMKRGSVFDPWMLTWQRVQSRKLG
jgi:hypothetical protein